MREDDPAKTDRELGNKERGQVGLWGSRGLDRDGPL